MSGRKASAWASMSWPARLLAIPVYLYRWLLSPLLPRNCRFEPSCSVFALEALSRHGAFIGGWLTFRRVCRCHPFESLGGGQGYDPVPEPPAVRRGGLRARLTALWEMGLSQDRRNERRGAGRPAETRRHG